MRYRFVIPIVLFLSSLLVMNDCFARGRGGGGGSHGGGRSHGGGGGGGSRGGGGFSGGGSPGAGGNGMRGANGVGGGGAGQNPKGFAGDIGLGGRGGSGFGNAGNGRAGGVGDGGAAQRAAGANRFSTPNSNQLNSFLGLPSDEGMHNLNSNDFNRNTDINVNANASKSNRSNVGSAGNNVDVNRGAAEGLRSGAGATRIQEKTVNRDAAARGVVARPDGIAADFDRVTPSSRYATGAAVRGNYNNRGLYNRNWYANYPGAWRATGWAANAIWIPSTWSAASSYIGYDNTQPMYYDYGNNVTYSGDNVYVNGDSVGTSEQYFDQAAALASSGANAEAPSDGDWMPLGVFALTKTDGTKSDVTIQLAVNKDGVIRGNSTDTETNTNQVLQGSVDKKTQRVAFTVGDRKEEVVETGLYNLTKDESPVLIHFGKDRTEQWLLVRLKNDGADAPTTGN